MRESSKQERDPAARSFFFRTVDAWIPEAIRTGPPDERRRARIVVGFTFVLLALCLEALAFFHWTLPAEATLWIEIAIAVGLGATLLIPVALRRYSIAVGANIVIAASFAVMVTIFSVLGGIVAPVLHWCALMPMLALLMGTPRSAIFWTAASFATVAGFTALELLGWPVMDYWSESAVARDRYWLQRVVDVSSWIGVLLTISILYERHKDEQTAHLSSINDELQSEIDQRHRAEARTRYLAYYDELTQLPNREFFKERLEGAMLQAGRQGRLVGLLFLDLDGFKEVNDRLGHAHGDRLLKIIADRLRTCVRLTDSITRGADDGELISRLGGDEFTVLLVGIRSAEEAAIVARRILAVLEPPVEIDDHELFISASIGISLYPTESGDAESLLRHADVAMYHVKDSGKNGFEFYSASMNAGIDRRALLGADLRRAVARGELEVYFQPILDTRSRRIAAGEALIRWNHPELGQLEPEEFVPLAEQNGLIVPIGEWLIESACRHARMWRDHVPELSLSVNVSSVQIRSAPFARAIARVLTEVGLPPPALELEITENAMMTDERGVDNAFSEISRLGCRIALDDFGTGYSSLAYLRRFPVDVIKVDRVFISEVATNPEAQAITKATIRMAHELGLVVVAEGVETEAQDAFLTRHRCDRLQGFRFGRPMRADQFEQLLVKQHEPDAGV